jgi:hypothetical protein
LKKNNLEKKRKIKKGEKLEKKEGKTLVNYVRGNSDSPHDLDIVIIVIDCEIVKSSELLESFASLKVLPPNGLIRY